MKAFDMSRFWRLVSVEGGRVTGTFWVASRDRRHKVYVKSVDVTAWADAEHTWGRTLYSNDLTASVTDGVVDLPKHMIATDRLADVEDAWDDMIAALAAVAEFAPDEETP